MSVIGIQFCPACGSCQYLPADEEMKVYFEEMAWMRRFELSGVSFSMNSSILVVDDRLFTAKLLVLSRRHSVHTVSENICRYLLSPCLVLTPPLPLRRCWLRMLSTHAPSGRVDKSHVRLDVLRVRCGDLGHFLPGTTCI